MASAWFYTRDGKRFGPCSSHELRELARTGHLSPEDLIWKEGMKEWQRAGDAKALFPPSLMPPPTPPSHRSPPNTNAANSTHASPLPPITTDVGTTAHASSRPSVGDIARGCLALVFAGGLMVGAVGTCFNLVKTPSLRVYDSLDELYPLIGGESPYFSKRGGATEEEVVAVLGKPAHMHSGGTLQGGVDDEVWTYYDKIRHKATGKLRGIEVHFRKGIVCQLDLR